jgi:Zn-dependent M28 family amino/carboxypeptidase
MIDVVAMLNFDMVGRLRDDRLSLLGAPSELSGIAREENTDSLQLVFGNSLSGRSDHACFQEAGKPALFFHTGLHEEYHTPFDEPWRINAAGMFQVAQLGMGVLRELVSRSDAPRIGG